jgi:hypothetical protein
MGSAFYLTMIHMKTKTKSSVKKDKYGKSNRSQPSRKRVEDRDVNEDEQGKITNARDDDDYSDETERFQRMPLDDVDAEEEREKKRRVEDARGEEEN